MVSVAFLPLVLILIMAFLGAAGWVWRKGKTIEALLI
jgi:hypothetical protein